jgi:hypothetical protein
MLKKINRSLGKFDLKLPGSVVLTEAATGNFVVTPIIAALAGAEVLAFTKDSHYGSAEDAANQTRKLAKLAGVENKVTIVKDLRNIDLHSINILTNCGHLRPIDNNILCRLSPSCVIPLMWEPWEYRREDIDLDACREIGIKVYGTNENDSRLKTMEYLGYVVLKLLLRNNLSPFSSNVLLVGNTKFVQPVAATLSANSYTVTMLTDYSNDAGLNPAEFDAIIILEHERNTLLIGKNALIEVDKIPNDTFVMHICGNVSFESAGFEYVPEHPKPFGHMSFTTDYVDNYAVIDLHTAGLKVAEGMLLANSLQLKGSSYKAFMESNYPALSFEDEKLW